MLIKFSVMVQWCLVKIINLKFNVIAILGQYNQTEHLNGSTILEQNGFHICLHATVLLVSTHLKLDHVRNIYSFKWITKKKTSWV